MKIIHIIGSFDPAKGGPQAVVVRLAAAQAALGHDVTILSYSDDAISARALKATAAIPGFECVKTFMLPIRSAYRQSRCKSLVPDDCFCRFCAYAWGLGNNSSESFPPMSEISCVLLHLLLWHA
jgi:hypothetical protein